MQIIRSPLAWHARRARDTKGRHLLFLFAQTVIRSIQICVLIGWQAALSMLRLLGFNAYLVRVQSAAIGHLATEPDSLWLDLEETGILERKPRFLFVPDSLNSNEVLLNLWKDKFRAAIGPAWLLGPKFDNRPLEALSTRRLVDSRGRLGRILWGTAVDYRASTSSNNAALRIEGALEAQAVEKLYHLGISPNDRIALINARDDAYYRGLPEGASYEDVKKLRNADIETYAAAARYLVSEGYVVVRMGAKVKSSISYSGCGVIDYATSGYRSELLDVFLFQMSQLVISNGTGLDSLALVFRKPMLYTNISYLVGLNNFYQLLGVHFILKLPLCAESGRKLSIKECFERAPSAVWDDLILREAKIDLQENSSEEILAATKDLTGALKTFAANEVKVESKDVDRSEESFWASYFRSTSQPPSRPWPRSTLSPSFWHSRKSWLTGIS